MTVAGWEAFNSHLLKGDLQAGRQILDGLHSQESGSAGYWKLRGDVHYRASEFAQALDIYIKLGRDFPGYLDHRYHLMDVCSHLGLPELGKTELARLVERSGLVEGLSNQVFAEGWTPLAMDEEVLGLDVEKYFNEFNHHVLLMMRGQSQMRASGIAAGIQSYHAGYCTPEAWRSMYSAKDTDAYWNGQPELPRRLVVRERGGLGDLMQWVRYAAILRCAGVQVEILGLNADSFQLAPVDEACFSDRLTAAGYRLAESDSPMWTDPFTLFTALFPVFGFAAGTRYLERSPGHPPPPLLGDIRSRARGKPCIGIFWSANESPAVFAVKSLQLQHLSGLLGMDDVHWVVFQRGHQRNLWLKDPRSLDAGHFTTVDASLSFDESIALAAGLDAMAGIDSGLTHACAALGTPCVLMANPATDWRWEKAGRSGWYPTVAIVRAPMLGAWEQVVDSAVQALRETIRGISD